MAKVAVIVPAAGASKRFGGSINKILLPLGGRPVVLRTLELFSGREDVCQILMPAAEGDADEMRRRFGQTLQYMGVELVAGGPVRSQSVRNALACVQQDAELVCVHDAVRPCVAQSWIDAVFARAAQTGAAILACPVHGTVKRVSPDNVIEQTVERTGLWEAQTPQVFRPEIIREAYALGEEATDDGHLVEAAGYAVSVVLGDPRNVKITTPLDLAFAEAILESLPA